MENEKTEPQKIDIMILLEDFLRQARRIWILGLVLVLVFSGSLAILRSRSYREVYEAYASFTVRVANPLYGSVSSYNDKTAQVMADTFPSILTSDLLHRKVMDKLGIKGIPSMSVSATAQSSILTLRVRDTDPQRAYDVLNAVIECYPEVSEFVVGSTVLVLLDESGIPGAPVNSFSYKQHLIQGAAVGGMVWCGIVLVLILLKNTVHNEEELRRMLNIPCLGQIPKVKVTKKMPRPLLHRTKDGAEFAESIRLLRLRVEKAMAEEDRKVLLVSSAIPGEGKTSTAVNLAIAMAQKGKKVLLIDCDLRNPSVAGALSSKSHPIGNANNLVDYIKGSVTVRDAIHETEVEGLYAIPGGMGGKGDNSALLSRNRMSYLIQASRNLYDCVILDTPPCSMLADAAELTELAEAGLMVIRQDYAARDQIIDGVQRMSDGKLRMIGCVFNHVHARHYGGYGYGGYGYGGYGGYGYGNKKK